MHFQFRCSVGHFKWLLRLAIVECSVWRVNWTPIDMTFRFTTTPCVFVCSGCDARVPMSKAIAALSWWHLGPCVGTDFRGSAQAEVNRNVIATRGARVWKRGQLTRCVGSPRLFSLRTTSVPGATVELVGRSSIKRLTARSFHGSVKC